MKLKSSDYLNLELGGCSTVDGLVELYRELLCKIRGSLGVESDELRLGNFSSLLMKSRVNATNFRYGIDVRG